MALESNEKIVKIICNMCAMGCGIDAHVKHGKVVQITEMAEHPHNRLCVKAKGMLEWLYSEERLTHPLQKDKGGWKKISWDQALGVISDKLVNIRDRYGAKALVLHQGVAFIGSHHEKLARRFADLYRTPNYTSGSTLCFYARLIGHNLTAGRHAAIPLFKNSNCMVLWGIEPEQCDHIQAAAIWDAKQRGAKLIVIDPRVTPMAKEADIYAQIRPGTDCALALALLNVIIGEDLYDKAFIERWTVGFAQLTEHTKQYTPERVQEITWVPAKTIRKLARTYATTKPAAVSQGIALDHCTNGVQTSRAIAILMAITGNFDVAGGNAYSTGLPQTNLRMAERVSMDEAIGAQYPMFTRFTRETTAKLVVDAILTREPYPIRALIVQGSNPALTWPNSNRVEEAFQKLDLLVVSDLFMTETAKLADVVLPAATFMEMKVLRDYGGPFMPLIVLGQQAIEPLGECIADWKLWAELGKIMGYGEYFPWNSDDELFETLLSNTNITLEQLKNSPGGIVYRPWEERKYLKKGFSTPSGKVEIYSELMEKHGYHPLPTFEEPAESPVSQPALAEKYPLILITGTRVKMFTHSQHRNISTLREMLPRALVEVHTQTAKNIGITDGDLVTIESPRGSIQLYAKLTNDIHPRVVSIQHGWSEANANILTDDKGHDPVSAFPGFKSVLCRITKG